MTISIMSGLSITTYSVLLQVRDFPSNTEWPKIMYTLFTHQYKGEVCIHFLGLLCMLVFSL
jgi:hypothetical protein